MKKRKHYSAKGYSSKEIANRVARARSEGWKFLDLGGCALQDDITTLLSEPGVERLRWLSLHSNNLSTLPTEIGRLAALEYLELEDNRFATLPAELGVLDHLKWLLVDGNPLSAELLRLSEEERLIDYFRELCDRGAHAQPFNEAKLLLIGPGEVGKTWLLQALQGKVPQRTESTKGIEIARQPLDVTHPTERDRVIHFNCWDFGGQDHYQVTHQIFFSPKAIYLLVWKPRPGVDPDLFARLERIELSAGSAAKVFIVSTHANDTVPAVVGEQAICERFGDLIGGFFKVDSAAGPVGTGISKLKQAIAVAAAELEGMDTSFPESWHKSSKAIRNTGSTTLPFGKFVEICRKEGMKVESAELLAMVMDVQGHAVYFSEAARGEKASISGPDNLVVLDPEWLAKAVVMVLEDQPTREHGGVLQHARLPAIWKEESRCSAGSETCLCGYLLWLMWKFDIAYRLDADTSLVPELIQRNRPDDLRWTPAVQSRERQATLIGRIPYNPPPGLIAVFTTAVHPLRRISRPIGEQQDPWDRNWRNGFFLDTLRRGTAFVELSDRDLRMTVRDAYPAHLLQALRRTLGEVIEDRWRNLRVDYCIPCSGRLDGKACPGSFKLPYLEPRRGKVVPCQDCGSDEIQVDHLLDGYDIREQEMMAALKEIGDGHQDLMALALNLYHEVMDPARAELERAPCMISIVPDGVSARNLVGKATKEFYRVLCWCEHPDGPHPDVASDYRLEMPQKWVVKVAPYVSWFVTLAKAFVPVVGKMVNDEMGDAIDKKLKKKIELMGGFAKTLPSGKLEVDRWDELDIRSMHGRRPEIVALRHIHDALLAHVPEGKRWGDLRPVHTKAHGVLWLCAKHAAIQDPPVQRITGKRAGESRNG
ncbi:MAG: COR domain-containing protein [FCB group bacterium]|nr:COR domain-containing protein [FCB group bacterium]